MRSAKLTYFLFFAFTALCVAAGMLLANNYDKGLLTSIGFLQSNTIPHLLSLLNLASGTKELILQIVMALNLIVLVLSYASFLIYLYFLRYRRLRRKRFGLIYDLTTNEPVPFAVLKLQGNESGKVVSQAVTDIYGRYNLIADSGKHRITVEHEGYETYTHDFKVEINDQQITQNIALSPLKARKLGLALKRAVNDLNESISAAGFVITALLLVLSFNPVNLIIFLIFGIQLILNRRTGEPRNWGSVYDTRTGQRLKGAFVSVLDPKDFRQLGSQMTDEKGRFGFILEEKSQYLVQVTLPGYKLTKINQNLTSQVLADGDPAILLPSGKVTDLDIGMELMFIDPSRKAFT